MLARPDQQAYLASTYSGSGVGQGAFEDVVHRRRVSTLTSTMTASITNLSRSLFSSGRSSSGCTPLSNRTSHIPRVNDFHPAQYAVALSKSRFNSLQRGQRRSLTPPARRYSTVAAVAVNRQASPAPRAPSCASARSPCCSPLPASLPERHTRRMIRGGAARLDDLRDLGARMVPKMGWEDKDNDTNDSRSGADGTWGFSEHEKKQAFRDEVAFNSLRCIYPGRAVTTTTDIFALQHLPSRTSHIMCLSEPLPTQHKFNRGSTAPYSSTTLLLDPPPQQRQPTRLHHRFSSSSRLQDGSPRLAPSHALAMGTNAYATAGQHQHNAAIIPSMLSNPLLACLSASSPTGTSPAQGRVWQGRKTRWTWCRYGP
ncbi:hypothetical protein GALMADRAFT_144670 [Galerina marginata CBS 339.88]|uniref:Uncharacterized protein n=1 Tax=Galerina marginata (strain CBS 339.88) TaxID=685588 RepID=A0A067SHI4_GALM3|nr:hypothetical protein GALMADRAFT_144670 [Galerina marginata CBS 339.88]